MASILLAAAPARAAVSVYISAPPNQNVVAADFGAGASYTFATETFTRTAGDFSGIQSGAGNGGVYTETGSNSISSTAAYGGGTGQGNYLSITAGATVVIAFSEPVNYFGFQWTAGNAGNRVTLYDTNNASLGTFDSATLTALLPNVAGRTVQAVNGSTYNTQSYYGLPGNRLTTSGEPFAYVHFINEGNLSISRIVLSHVGGGAFESDNHSIRAAKITVDIPTSPIVSVGTVPVPEPGVVTGVMATGLLVMMGRRRASGFAAQARSAG